MLDDEQVERYARQIVVPGIGAAGQEKLLDSTVLVVGHPRGRATAELYLRAAGLTVTDHSGDMDVAVVCDPCTIDDAQRDELDTSGKPVCWYSVESGDVRCGVGRPENSSSRTKAENAEEALHDVGACEAVSLACAVLLGL